MIKKKIKKSEDKRRKNCLLHTANSKGEEKVSESVTLLHYVKTGRSMKVFVTSYERLINAITANTLYRQEKKTFLLSNRHENITKMNFEKKLKNICKKKKKKKKKEQKMKVKKTKSEMKANINDI